LVSGRRVVAMRLVNVTPHAVTLISPTGERVTVPPSGVVARVAERMESLGEVMVDGVPLPVVRRSFGELEGLPEPEAGVLYVASALVAEAAWRVGRSDVVGLADFVRDEQGRIVGARALVAAP
jgi:hypothetical protein